MGIKQKVTVTTDIITPGLFPCGASQHVASFLVPPSPVPTPPGPVPHIEIPTTAFWPPGNLVGQNKFSTTVRHQWKTIALEGHDCGIMIVHVSIPPFPINLLLALIIPFSSRKMMFSASTVKINGTATGTSDLLSIPTPMMTCMEPISLPTSFPHTNAFNTVNVGMTWQDFVAGYAAIAISMAADALTAGPGGGKMDWFDAIAGKFFGAGSLKEWGIKTAAGIATGLIKIGLTGEGSFDIGVGSPFLGGKYTVGCKTDEKGERHWSFGPSGNAGPFQGSETTEDGKTSKTTSSNDLFGSQTTKTEYDPKTGKRTVVTERTEIDPMTGTSSTTKTTKTHSGKFGDDWSEEKVEYL